MGPLIWSLTYPCPAPWIERFEGVGLKTFHIPFVRIERVGDGTAIDSALRRLSSYDGVVFTSRHAVRMTGERLDALGVVLSVPIFCVGPSTAGEIEKRGWKAETVGRRYSGEGLVAGLVHRFAYGGRLLFPRSTGSNMAPWTRLKKKGIEVDGIDLYRPCPITFREGSKVREIVQRKGAWVTFGSPSGIEAWINIWGSSPQATRRLEDARVAAIGKTTARALKRLGIVPGIIAGRPTAEHLCRAIYGTVRSEGHGPFA